MALLGCDTFVVLPSLTSNGDIVFGKNSDRPSGEVQEIVYEPSKSYKEQDKAKCTFIEIEQALYTHAVFLSKPAWMWGAEMGANSCGVVIGNEAVWTVLDEPKSERLLGMDLLRLGLERASTSSEAVTVITTLLEKYGQGGPCSDSDSDLFYHNSFLIADRKEAWILETVGHLWAAEKVTNGFRNISNCLSIGTNISSMSNSLFSFVKEHKLWNGEGEFSFKDAFSTGGCPRETNGCKLLFDLTGDKQFDLERMIKILRDQKSGICMPVDGSYHTASSWVSVLSADRLHRPPCHWVTGTPDPTVSLFKPFIFSPSPKIPECVCSPTFKYDPAKNNPRFNFTVDRRHLLYKLHETALKNNSYLKSIREKEKTLIKNISHILSGIDEGSGDLRCYDKLFINSVEDEMQLYSQCSRHN